MSALLRQLGVGSICITNQWCTVEHLLIAKTLKYENSVSSILLQIHNPQRVYALNMAEFCYCAVYGPDFTQADLR